MRSSGAGQIVFDLDANVYRLAAIKKAAYKFGDRCFVQIETAPSGRVRVVLRPKSATIAGEELKGEFENEVLDQELREVVQQETEAVRNLLLAQAFSATSLIDPTGECDGYSDDPLQIRESRPADDDDDVSR
jgi:His-Xaa-Ser system protein HxsD